MHAYTVSYEDFNGNPRTETLYFHMGESELIKMEADYDQYGGIAGRLRQVVADRDGKVIVEFVEDLISKSYGIKSGDGLRHEKSEDLRAAFMQGNAYQKIFLELAFNATKAADFVNKVLPVNLSKDVDKILSDQGLTMDDIMARAQEIEKKIISGDATPATITDSPMTSSMPPIPTTTPVQPGSQLPPPAAPPQASAPPWPPTPGA